MSFVYDEELESTDYNQTYEEFLSDLEKIQVEKVIASESDTLQMDFVSPSFENVMDTEDRERKDDDTRIEVNFILTWNQCFIFFQNEIDSLHHESLDNDDIVSGFLRHMDEWDNLTLVVVGGGKMHHKKYRWVMEEKRQFSTSKSSVKTVQSRHDDKAKKELCRG